MSEVIVDSTNADTIDVSSMQPSGGFGRFWRQFLHQKVSVVAAIIFALILLLAAFAALISPYDPLSQNLEATFQGVSFAHWFGTDSLGRDVLSRLLFGAQQSIPAAALATAFAMAIGIPVGLLMGYFGKWLDRLGMMATDVLLTVPGVILAIALVAVFGNSLVNAMLALGLVFSPSFVRLARAEALNTRSENYITAAGMLGYSDRRIVFRHLLPNIVPSLIVQTFLSFSFALLAQSGLAFIGIGVKPPAPAWGAMLADSITYMSDHSMLVIPPGVAIAITALCASLIGDGIRDSLGAGIRATSVTRSRKSRALFEANSAKLAPIDENTTLSVTDLEVGYYKDGQWIAILDRARLEVVRGKTTGVVGESGSGKSVTALAIMGLLPSPLEIRSGSIRLGGVELLALGEKDLRKLRGRVMSMIFQDPLSALNPTLTIGQQLIETVRLYRPMSASEARNEAIRLLERVEISRPADRLAAYPYEFSGGMAQRVMIAMAIAASPDLIIADEPTTALDVTVQVEILDLLRQLQGETGVGILFITHDMAVVADICDSASVMYKGRIVETNSVEDLFSAPKDAYSRELLSLIPTQSDSLDSEGAKKND